MDCHLIRYEPFESGSLDFYPAEDKNIIFQGSISLAKQIQKEKSWTVFASWDNLKCSTYYAHWGKYLLNSDYIMMPFAELKRRFKELLMPGDPLYPGGAFFVRPDSNAKTFSATVLSGVRDFGTDDKIKNTWERLLYDPPATELVIIAPVKPIHREWRVICSKGKVITGSRYKTWNQVDYKAELPDAVKELALEICSGEFQPDPIYVLDICDSPSKGTCLLEAGALSVAGLYHCDLEALVREASKILG